MKTENRTIKKRKAKRNSNLKIGQPMKETIDDSLNKGLGKKINEKIKKFDTNDSVAPDAQNGLENDGEIKQEKGFVLNEKELKGNGEIKKKQLEEFNEACFNIMMSNHMNKKNTKAVK